MKNATATKTKLMTHCPHCEQPVSYHRGCGGRKVPYCEPCGLAYPRGMAKDGTSRARINNAQTQTEENYDF